MGVVYVVYNKHNRSRYGSQEQIKPGDNPDPGNYIANPDKGIFILKIQDAEPQKA
jgi:hypothetical protein